ncbi:hypothetical protein AB1Y20_021749 [Prymnesium parvum]|uniref:Uncharacterized protein n=1 Tax=Prymnesium parvum TaxID=97485 RepID=A0AB34JN38_PRYPA|mmetsp:Transcript_12449/g.29626  ORF Transcript_12449/g.29626 Transcript_12449/m.29626 type:complete len:344 (+) Transcript_12449:82-1113(+)
MAQELEVTPIKSPWKAETFKDKEMTPWMPWVVPLESTSTYTAHYKNWGTQRSPSCKPKNERVATAPFNARSTAQDSYLPWDKDGRRESCKPLAKSLGHSKFENSTTHRDAYRPWNVGKQASFKPQQTTLEPHKFVARSTHQDSYVGHDGVEPRRPFLPAETLADKTKFDGISTMNAHYLPWPVQKNGMAPRPVPQLDLGGDPRMPTGTTAHRDAYTELRLPSGCKAALGVQVIPGKFHLMIPKGSSIPTKKSGIFTTTADNQQVIEVVVIAMPDNNGNPDLGVELGHFPLGKILPTRAGVAQVDVTMNLGLDSSIRVTAHNRQNDYQVSMIIRDKFKYLKFER